LRPLTVIEDRRTMGRSLTPLGALARGLLAGTAGTLAMDAVWYRRYRRGGGTQGFLRWEFSVGIDTWDRAPAPALAGKRMAEGFLQKEIPGRYAWLVNNITHWGYGVGWGGVYGLVAGTVGPWRVYWGPPFGAAVWSSSYVTLPLAGLYKPIWQYDLHTLAEDLSAHLVYGGGTAVTFAALSLR
jgi:hypothetical protein